MNSGIKNVIYHSDYIDAEASSNHIFEVTGTSCVKFDDVLQNPATILKIRET